MSWTRCGVGIELKAALQSTGMPLGLCIPSDHLYPGLVGSISFHVKDANPCAVKRRKWMQTIVNHWE